jgi:hypothetical protein
VALWALASILAGVALVGISERLTARLPEPRHMRLPEPRHIAVDRYAPALFRATVMLAGGYLIALGIFGL